MRSKWIAICALCSVVMLLIAACVVGCGKKAGEAKSGSAQPTKLDQERMKGSMPPGAPGTKGSG